MVDLVEIKERQKAEGSIRPWFLQQAERHKSAIVQIFLGPFSRPAVLLSDYHEVRDLLMHRDLEVKRGKKVDVFSGVLPHAFPAMESFDPNFKRCRSLMRGFYVSWPRLYHMINKIRPSVRRPSHVMTCYIDNRIRKAISSLDSGDGPQCALDYMIRRETKEAEEADYGHLIHNPRIRDGIHGYLIAGHDTTMGSLAWLLRRLASEPEEQVKIRESLRQKYDAAWSENRLPTAAELAKSAPYLDAFIEECLRCHCPVPTIAVQTRTDTSILGYAVPKDTPVFLNLTGPSLSMPSIPVSEDVRSVTSRASCSPNARLDWDDADPAAFKPERWLKKDRDGKMVFNALSGPTLSFSTGDRGC